MELFASAKSESPMEDTSVWLMRDTGTPGDPMILLVTDFSGDNERLRISERQAVLLPRPDGVTPFKAEFRTHLQIYLR
jgi:hypothetical protein